MFSKERNALHSFKCKIPFSNSFDLRLITKQSKAAVIDITETWLDESVNDSNISKRTTVSYVRTEIELEAASAYMFDSMLYLADEQISTTMT